MDYKLERLRNEIADLEARRATSDKATLRQLDKRIADLTADLDEINEFAKTMERITREGYEPGSDWVDDGVILRLATNVSTITFVPLYLSSRCGV